MLFGRDVHDTILRLHGLMVDSLTTLTRTNAQEILAALKLVHLGTLQPMVNWLAGVPARRLSRKILHFDDLVGQHGLADAGRYLLDEFTQGVDIDGTQHVPRHGPLLVVANHPGLVDAMAIWVALEARPDLKIIAADRDIFQLLPNMRRRLLIINPQVGCGSGMLREAIRHLRQGHALLTFPAGRIEPDPAVRRVTATVGWSDSSGLFVRAVPETNVLPIAVSGVISTTALRHPVARCFTDRQERDWAAATLQVLRPKLRDTRTRVVIGEPVGRDQANLALAIDAAMARSLARLNGELPLHQTAVRQGGGDEAGKQRMGFERT